MKYFKTIAFLLSFFALAISCHQQDKFNSLGSEENNQFLGSEEEPEYKKEIQELVSQKEIVKIGGKKSNDTIRLSETVGENQLKDNTDEEHTAVADEKAEKSKASPNKVVTIEVKVKEKKMKYKKNLSLLFYIEDKKSYCLRQFTKHSQTFLKHLNQAPHWDMAFSFHRDNKELIKLKQYKGYVLSKGAHPRSSSLTKSSANRIFKTTLAPYYPNESDNSHYQWQNKNQGPSQVVNPLKGLSHALKTFAGNKGPKVVLYFDDDFPYYSSKEWKDFYKKHKNLTILSISQRAANLSNFETGFKAKVDLTPVMGCRLGSTKLVTETSKHILSRLK